MVSVILPADGRLEDLRFTLESIEAQTYGNLEVIAVDHADGAVREPSHRGRHPVRFVRPDIVPGLAAARNAGAFLARGEYLCFPRSGWRLDPRAIASMVESLEGGAGHGIVRTFPRWDGPGGEGAGGVPPAPASETLLLVPRSVFTAFDETLEAGIDPDLERTLAREGVEIVSADGEWVLGSHPGPEVPSEAVQRLLERKHRWWDDDEGVAHPEITAISVTYRTPELVRAAYSTLRGIYPNLRIVMVDGSGDHPCADYVGKLEAGDPLLRAFRYGYNIGHGRGMHAALTHIQSRFALIFDSDVEFREPGLIEAMRAALGEGMYGVGDVQRVNRRGFNVKRKGIAYLHPALCLIDRRQYFRFHPFAHHGAPAIHAMIDLADMELSERMLGHFPVDSFAYHRWEGTRQEFGIEPWSYHRSVE